MKGFWAWSGLVANSVNDKYIYFFAFFAISFNYRHSTRIGKLIKSEKLNTNLTQSTMIGEQTMVVLTLLMQSSQTVGDFCDGCHSTSQYLNILFNLNKEGIQLEPGETGKSGVLFMVGGLNAVWQSTDCWLDHISSKNTMYTHKWWMKLHHCIN